MSVRHDRVFAIPLPPRLTPNVCPPHPHPSPSSCNLLWVNPPQDRDRANHLFIKNLHPFLNNKDLYDAFSLFGNVLFCKVAVDGDCTSKGYGYVHYEEEAAAAEAMRKVSIGGFDRLS